MSLPQDLFSENDSASLASSRRLALVGKFLNGRPNLDIIRKKFDSLKLAGSYKIGLLDGRHILIQLTREEDYIWLFVRKMIKIDNRAMKLFKWSVDFDPQSESPIVPVWIRFPGLKLHLFNHEILFSLAAAYGRPLKMDYATCNLTRPSVARVLVERDITQVVIDEVWIGTTDKGYWQQVVIEQHPLYCSNCRRFGHSSDNCYILHPELNIDVRQVGKEVVKPQENVPIEKLEDNVLVGEGAMAGEGMQHSEC